MSNTYTRDQRDARRERRLDWLRTHPHLLRRLPGANEHVHAVQSVALDVAVDAMKLDGVYAQTSDRKASRWGIRLLVSMLRGEQ